jgi:protoporphyrinogen oxidase
MFGDTKMKVKDSIMIDDKYITDDETIFTMSIDELIRVLENDFSFYENPTKEQMEKVLNAYLKEQIKVLKEDFGYYLKTVMPKLITDLK